MKTPMTVCLLLIVFGTAASAHAQDTEWEAINKELMSLYQKSQYDRVVLAALKK